MIDPLDHLMIIIFLIGCSLFMTVPAQKGAEAYSLIKKCEQELPRSQKCQIIAEPIPVEDLNNEN